MVRQTARVIILEILAGVVILSIVAMVALAIRLASGPIELNLFKGQIEQTLENNRDGRKVTLENISLEWLSDEKRVVVTASDLRLFNAEEEIAAEAAHAEILLDIGGLFVGKVRPIGLVLDTGWINVRQSETGWRVAGDPIGSRQVITDEEIALDPQDLLETANQALIDVLGVLRRDADALPLERLEFMAVDFVLLQGEDGERGRLSNTQGGFVRGTDGIALKMSGENLSGADSPGRFSATLDAPGDYTQIDAAFVFEDWSLEAVANVFPATTNAVTGLPADLRVGLSADAERGLTQVTFNAAAGAGSILYNGSDLQVGKAGLDGRYIPEQDRLEITLNDFDIGLAEGTLSIEISDFFKAETVRQFSFNSPALALDVTPRFSDVWRPERVKASGLLDLARRKITLQTASLQINDATLRAAGDIVVLENLQGRDLPVQADLSAEITGILQPEELMWFWPVKQAPGARAYVTRIVKEGYISGATAQVRLRRDSFAEGHLADEAISASFSATNALVRPLPDIPDVRGINAVGQMTGNSLMLTFEDAAIGAWNIDKGSVSYPRLSPAGFDMTVSIEGRGPATSLVQMVSDSRLQLEARTGLDPSNVSGDAVMALTMTRPAKPKVPLSEYRYTGTGTVRGAGLAQAFNGLSLTDSDARVDLDEKGIRIAGFGAIASSPLQYDWSYQYNDENIPARLKATSLVTPDIINAFGIVGRAYLTGEAPVEFEAELDGAKLRTIDAAFDLLTTRLDIAELNWVKPAGEAATASLRYALTENGPTTAVTLNAETASIDATFTQENNGKLVSGNIERLFLKDRVDLGGNARRTETGGLLFTLSGAFLDLSRFLPGVSSIGGDDVDQAERFGDVSLEADFETLRLRPGFETMQTRLSMVSDRKGVQTLEADGLLPNGADFDAAYDASGLGEPSFLINSGDASFLASVFLGIDSFEGGTLQMSGTLASDQLPTQMRLVIENGRLKDAPFVTQILSLASLRGLSDTLSGDGVLFTVVELPLTIEGGNYRVVGARASGPALGLTANGNIIPETGEINIDGVLVPSFGLNSALGGIPVIGDLFVSRQGEGVISLRYGIEGTLEKAQVSVNPLSAITPGVLRRIFENPAEEQLPEVAPDQAPDQTPEPIEPIPDE